MQFSEKGRFISAFVASIFKACIREKRSFPPPLAWHLFAGEPLKCLRMLQDYAHFISVFRQKNVLVHYIQLHAVCGDAGDARIYDFYRIAVQDNIKVHA